MKMTLSDHFMISVRIALASSRRGDRGKGTVEACFKDMGKMWLSMREDEKLSTKLQVRERVDYFLRTYKGGNPVVERLLSFV
jgi:hypothetical protein